MEATTKLMEVTAIKSKVMGTTARLREETAISMWVEEP